MKAAYKRKWLQALRSGKFRRAIGTLKSDRGFCCLGVLATVADIPITENYDFLKPAQLKKVGLTQNEQHLLSRINDGSKYPNDVKGPKGYSTNRGSSFKATADWIEKNL